MGRISRLFSFKSPKFSIDIPSTFTTIISGPKLKIKKKLSISLPQLDPIYHPYRDFSNTVTGTGTTGATGTTTNGGFYDQISIHGYAVPARFIAAEHIAIFLDTLPIGDFKRLGQLVITASVGRLGHLSLLPDSDHLIMVAVTKLKGISMERISGV
ncbi:hypothetical protein TWF970_002488 [Orbilia oligospora]|uniref:Uncharacterized protein n=1 Tax=Orbilia oligospora TaxID=2813651 RepID=A0A7C8RC30_ORBOL|nr:hypothetical protein TWF970_002488 [Orbilia oligospora]